MDNFEEFKYEVIAEIKANPHHYPGICRRMVQKIEDQHVEIERLTEERNALAKGIGDAVVVAGIAHSVSMNGPELLLMLECLAELSRPAVLCNTCQQMRFTTCPNADHRGTATCCDTFSMDEALV